MRDALFVGLAHAFAHVVAGEVELVPRAVEGDGAFVYLGVEVDGELLGLHGHAFDVKFGIVEFEESFPRFGVHGSAAAAGGYIDYTVLIKGRRKLQVFGIDECGIFDDDLVGLFAFFVKFFLRFGLRAFLLGIYALRQMQQGEEECKQKKELVMIFHRGMIVA